MWTMWMVAAATAGQVDEDVARGWYLWQTGQEEAAYEVADEIGLDGASGAVWPFVVAMAVERGQGPSVEAELRDRWSEARSDANARIGLAWAISLRRQGEGTWCDEVVTLLKPVNEGIDRYWAAKAGMEREQRCVGSTEHAEAQLRRIAKAGDGPAADAAFGTLRQAYFKDGFPDQLEAALEEQPHGVAEAGVAWSKKASGTSVPGTRRVLSKALEKAAESDEPSLVYAAMLGYRDAGKDKQADAARERLESLDSQADPDAQQVRTDIVDPPPFGDIQDCTETAASVADGVACLEAIDVPDGALLGYQQHLLRVLYQQKGDADSAFEAAKAAWTADPTNRTYATAFAHLALEREEGSDEAVEAAAAVLAGRMPENAAEVPEALRRRRAEALDRLAALEVLAGREDEALDHMLLAVAIQDVPARRHRLGHALAAAGRADDAVIVLLRALGTDVDDSALVGESRRLVAELIGEWHPGGLKGALAELDGNPPDPHPLVGESFPEGVLPEMDWEVAPTAQVVVLWDDTSEVATSALVRLEGIARSYGERGVAFHAVDVGMMESVRPDEVTLRGVEGSSGTLRALQLVAVPSLVVVDDKDEVRAVLAGYDAGGLDLEKALDAFLPEAEE